MIDFSSIQGTTTKEYLEGISRRSDAELKEIYLFPADCYGEILILCYSLLVYLQVHNAPHASNTNFTVATTQS